MGLIRFMTVFDDEYGTVLNPSRCKKFDISSPGTFFRADNYSYLDNFNVSSRDYIEMCKSAEEISSPRIPSDVFYYSFEKQQQYGYLYTFAICPHAKWSNYYKDAVHAARKIHRKAKNNNDEFFHINVINSKAFGIGTVLFANTLARDYYHYKYPVPLLIDYSKRYAKSSETFVLTKIDTNKYKSFKIRDTRITEIDIGESAEEVQFDNFADYISKTIKKRDGQYAASFGYNCDFAGNIIGLIEKRTKHVPLVCAQYGIVTAEVFGTNTICFHFGEYI